jgi:tetratricopeptide (TPR) repeat protein/class 3 adenylate cyclase
MEQRPTKLKMAHVVFMDIVGYSKLPMDHQEAMLRTLQEIVSSAPVFLYAEANKEMVRLPTGDGMALVFFEDAETAAHCALEVSRELKARRSIPLRMGLHSGPVYRVEDINANQNVAGEGINIAQRVMDCGDAGHVLVSQSVADVLGQLSSWKESLHDLGEAEVKHGVRVHLHNLYTDDAGNAEVPQKLHAAKQIAATMHRKSRRKKLALGLAAAGAVAALATLFLYPRHALALKPTDTIVLSDFANSTGDAVFDDTLKQGLATDLQQSPFFNILPDRTARATLRLMSRKPDDRVTAEMAQDICQRTQSKAVVAGSIASLGSQYVIGLNAVNCQTGESLARETAQAAKKEDVLNALDRAAKQLRERVGESVSSIQKYDTPLAQATTPSLEALKYYTSGASAAFAGDRTAAIPFYQRAIELDPNFALAYQGLGTAYHNLGQNALANDNFRKASDLSGRVSEREKLLISAFYFSFVTGELGKASQVYERWSQTYPREFAPHSNLGVIHLNLGQHDKALEEHLEALRLSPESGVLYGILVGDFSRLNRLGEAKTIYEQALARKFESAALHDYRYGVAFLEGDAAELDRQVTWGSGQAGVEDVLFSQESDTHAFWGRLAKARAFSRRAADSANHAGEKETAAGYRMNAALREAEFGNAAQARSETASAMILSSTRDVRILAALALARVGDSERAEKMADDLEKGNALDTVIVDYWLPTIRAAIEIDRKNPSKAIEILQAAIPYELGYVDPEIEVGGLLYPVYVRGQAYLLLRDGTAAAAEFQKFLDHRGVVVNCWLGPLAHLGLARAYALQGDTAKARAAYQDFLTLWKDADPDIPILKQAQTEYAKLQ